MCNFGQAEYVQARLAIIINPRAAITKFVDSKRGKDLFFLYVVVKIGHKRSREGGEPLKNYVSFGERKKRARSRQKARETLSRF